jgi:hypothetical protein
VHNRVKRWANILNWAFGILLSIATPATADVAFLFGNTPQGDLGTHASGLPKIEHAQMAVFKRTDCQPPAP